MTMYQLPVEIAAFGRWLTELVGRAGEDGGWYGVFAARDPEGLRACLDGVEILPWDIVASLLQDAGETAGGPFAARGARLYAAAAGAHDRRPGGVEALAERRDLMERERRHAGSRARDLGERLRTTTDAAEAARLEHDLAWTRDDHARATARVAELTGRLARLGGGTPDTRGPAAAHRDPHTGPRAEAPAAFPTGSPAGATAGSLAGFPVGSPAGSPGGAPDGFPAGATAGSLAGFPAGSPAGSPAGATAGATAGSLAGFPAGSPAGATAGSLAGFPVGSPAGSPGGAPDRSPAGATAGSLAGFPVGSPAGSPAGAPAGASARAVRSGKGGRRPRGARYAWLEESADLVEEAPVPPPPLTAGGAAPRGARFGGAETAAPAAAPADPVEAARAAANAVYALRRLRAQGRSGEAHALLCEALAGPPARLPALAAELHRSGMDADWSTLLWEAASLPPGRLAAVAGALADAGRPGDCEQLLRQGVARPVDELAGACAALRAEGHHREAHALLTAFVRVRAPEDAARLAGADPRGLVPRLLAAARAVSASRERDLVHALRVAGLAGA
ncbi:UL36 very large tegument protein [Streptomyces sp. NPDC096319]|uniref:UL36 very large tegument protein n=1 Tax=Streptomyces sp. NPDC096319 TaxID=3366084 RepID=UPI00382321AB